MIELQVGVQVSERTKEERKMVDMDGKAIKLTRREAEVLPFLELGMTYKEIGVVMGITWMTVRCLLHGLYEKSGVYGPNARVIVVNLWRKEGGG